MSVTYICDRCGVAFQSNHIHIGGTGTAYMAGNTVDCPKPWCSGTGHHAPGTYEFVDGVIAAFTAPGMTREKVEAVREVAAKAAQNELSPAEAAQEADTIKAGLGDLFLAAHQRGITFDRVLAVIVGFLAAWAALAPDADLQALVEESQRQTELTERMLEELQKQSAADDTAKPRVVKPPAPPTQTSASKNRAERRKAAAIERRTKGRGE